MRTRGFELSHIRRTSQSTELASGGSAASRPTPISLAVVACLHCDESWTATAGTGRGQLERTIGGVRITCPKCLRTSVVTDSDLRQL